MIAPETSENQARWSLGDAQSDLCPERQYYEKPVCDEQHLPDNKQQKHSRTSKERLKMHALDMGCLVISENEPLCVDHAFAVNPELKFS
jgi:hypothetical protein